MAARKRGRGNVVSRYMAERAAWKEAGHPVRTDEEVDKIFKDICSPCEFFRKGRGGAGRCTLCGCRVNIGKGTNFNKLRWATTSCPDNPPRWTASHNTEEKPNTEETNNTEENKDMDAPATEMKLVAQAETRRQKRRREREERKKAREDRRASRKKRAVDKEERLGKMPQQIKVEETKDDLEVFDRYLRSAGHALRDMWKHCPAFLVCGGPSLNTIDLEQLKHPAICSMGVNNVAAYAPVKSFVFSDPVEKFHHGIFLNPGILKFAPRKKLQHRVRAKKPDGTFEFTKLRAGDFPSIYGFSRDTDWNPATFFARSVASWGCGKRCAETKKKGNVLFTPLLGLRLLHYLGVPRVYLLGVDFNMKPGEAGGYAFNQGRTFSAASSNNTHYKRVTELLTELRPIMEAHKFYVYNCNPESHCNVFDYISYEDAIKDCLSLMPPEPYDLSGWYEKDIRRSFMEDDDEEEHRE